MELAPPNNNVTPTVPEQVTNILDYGSAAKYINRMIDNHAGTIQTAKENRDRRRVDINVRTEREAKRLKNDETIIIDRVIDRNIAREKPSYIAFIQQSRRLCQFVDLNEPERKPEKLEAAFTRGMTYSGWLLPHYAVLDGAQLHGFDFVEIVYDSNKPLNASIEHIGFDRLLKPADVEDIQACERLARIYQLSRTQLNEFVDKFGFDKDAVESVIQRPDQVTPIDQAKEVSGIDDRTFTVYKIFAKNRADGYVYVSWYARNAQTWLKAPAPLYIGVDRQVTIPSSVDPLTGMVNPGGTGWGPEYETSYPIRVLVYEVTEEKQLNKYVGRSFKDKYLQEAKTAGWTAFTNGNTRACGVYASPKDPQSLMGMDVQKLESIELKHGMITGYPLQFWGPNYPSPTMLSALQALDLKQAQDIGNMTFAVQNKSAGARTTATEIGSAEKAEAELDSVQITLYSTFIREVYSLVWRIVRSQALQNKILLVGGISYVQAPLTGAAPVPVIQNDPNEILREYDVRAAGDTDVIQRNLMISTMMQWWSVIANTPIAGQFLGKMLKLQFHEDGEIWANMLQTESQAKGLLVQLAKIVQAAMTDPAGLKQIGPQEIQNINMLLQEVQNVVAPTAGSSTMAAPTANSGSAPVTN